MRIAIINWSSRKVGGIETYLNALIPELVAKGNEVAFCFEGDDPVDRDRISLPRGVPSWGVSSLGTKDALRALREWRPDILFVQKLKSPEWEAGLFDVAPAVFFAHDYEGMCISGSRTHQLPIARPCERRFGAACLLHYFPRRCGGLNPATMVKLYRSQNKRLELLPRYDAVVTHSTHMLRELIKHGVLPQRAHSFPFLVELPNPEPCGQQPVTSGYESENADAKDLVQLVFSGRMERLKGGHVLLDSLFDVQRSLNRKVRVVFAGDGRERPAWEREGAWLHHQQPALEIEFVGWIDRLQLGALFNQSDLMVVPSLWPEPFGLAGPEAGVRGLPVAAFAVGGISEWLEDGVNGFLAPGDPPTAKGLAKAIIRCLENAETYASLRGGAERLSRRFQVENHLTSLMGVFEQVTAAGKTDPRLN